MMKGLHFVVILVVLALPLTSDGGERELFLNAFGETATAYLNDAFLLLGTTADGYVADQMAKETAGQIAKNVQKRVRIIRSRIRAVTGARLADADKNLLGLLDKAYGCLDHQAWSLYEYVEDRNPDTARRFEQQRTSCLEHIKRIAELYSTLPPSPELPEPLSTR
jgi:hypothetical protein